MNLKKIVGILTLIILVIFSGNTEAATEKLTIVRVYDGGAYELNEKLKAGGFIPANTALDKGTRQLNGVTPYYSIAVFSKSYVSIIYQVNDEGHVSLIMIESPVFEKNNHEKIIRQICLLLGLSDSQTDKLFNSRYDLDWLRFNRLYDIPYAVAKNRKFNMTEEFKDNKFTTIILAFI